MKKLLFLILSVLMLCNGCSKSQMSEKDTLEKRSDIVSQLGRSSTKYYAIYDEFYADQKAFIDDLKNYENKFRKVCEIFDDCLDDMNEELPADLYADDWNNAVSDIREIKTIVNEMTSIKSHTGGIPDEKELDQIIQDNSDRYIKKLQLVIMKLSALE